MTQKTDNNTLATPESSDSPEGQAAQSAKKAKAKNDKAAAATEGKTTPPAPEKKQSSKRASTKEVAAKDDPVAEKKAEPRKSAKKPESRREKKTDTGVKKQGKLIDDIRLYDVIERPVITEKSTVAAEQNKVVFNIAPTADKKQVKQAVEALFKVDVLKVNTINTKGKVKRFRGRVGQRSDQRKAIVTLKEGQSIDLAAGLK